MAEIKDKVVTVESLAALHEHNKQTYMPKTNPVGEGTMTMNGNANISGDMVVGSLMIGANIKLVPTGDALEIVFVND
jgi:hypothetical protein